MKINGITGHNFSSQKQVNFGIIKDKGAEEIIKKNALNECTFAILASSKFFIFSSEGQKLKVKLDEDFLRERTTDLMTERVKTDKHLDYENPLNTLDAFEAKAFVYRGFEDTSEPSVRERLAQAEKDKDKPYTPLPDRSREETEAQVWREAHGFWF